ncbi:MAG: site-specific integrase [Defluviitaleaceae bacterium]|nr:site-specific integrase [Defluviitaleaceae bacterium]
MIHTVGEATKDFLVKARTNTKESTLSQYGSICTRHILPYFQHMELTSINNEVINNFIKYKLKNGGLRGNALSPKYTNDMVNLLMQIIKPYCNFDINFAKPSCTQEEISIFTEAEYNRLKSHVSIGTDNRKLGIIIAMLTGIRIGELCALKWENIDLEIKGTIFIDKTMQRIESTDDTEKAKTKIIIDTPKSPASIRKIPLQEVLLTKLKEFRSDDGSYVLTNTRKYIEPRTYQRQFKSYLQACNIPETNFHTLRHTFATRSIARKVDPKSLSISLGHTDVGFTMKRYVHPDIEYRRTQMEKVATGF